MQQIHLFAEWSESSLHVWPKMTEIGEHLCISNIIIGALGIRWLIIDEIEKEGFCSIPSNVLTQWLYEAK